MGTSVCIKNGVEKIEISLLLASSPCHLHTRHHRGTTSTYRTHPTRPPLNTTTTTEHHDHQTPPQPDTATEQDHQRTANTHNPTPPPPNITPIQHHHIQAGRQQIKKVQQVIPLSLNGERVPQSVESVDRRTFVGRDTAPRRIASRNKSKYNVLSVT